MCNDSCDLISLFSDIANIVIAFVNVALVIYIFSYTRKNDSRQIRLQWFKELIILPKLEFLNNTFDNLLKQAGKLSDPETQISDVVTHLKSYLYEFRAEFAEGLIVADKQMKENVVLELDQLLDIITSTVYDKGINLTDFPTLEKKVINPIRYSRIKILNIIYSFKG